MISFWDNVRKIHEFFFVALQIFQIFMVRTSRYKIMLPREVIYKLRKIFQILVEIFYISGSIEPSIGRGEVEIAKHTMYINIDYY